MTQIHSSTFGRIDIEDRETYVFPEGVPGFEQEREFIWIDVEGHAPLSYLQSTADPELFFMMIDPFIILPQYEFELSDKQVQDLQIESDHPVVIRVIVNAADGLENATCNLAAPLVFNGHHRTARQIVLARGEYATRHRLFSPKAQS